MKKIFYIVCGFVLNLLITATVYAAIPVQGQPITLGEVGMRIEQIVRFLIEIAGVVAAGYIIWAGIKWVSAGNDPKKVEDAKASLKAGVIGLLVILGFAVIILTVSSVVNRSFFG